MLQKQVVHIRMSELASQQLTVGTWEVPILAVVHGGNLSVVDAVEVDEDAPDAQQEYERLERRYGVDREEGGLPYVAQVYGQHMAGVQQLQRAIEGAVIDAKPKGKAKEDSKAAAS
jgi:hypothetical protein